MYPGPGTVRPAYPDGLRVSGVGQPTLVSVSSQVSGVHQGRVGDTDSPGEGDWWRGPGRGKGREVGFV